MLIISQIRRVSDCQSSQDRVSGHPVSQLDRVSGCQSSPASQLNRVSGRQSSQDCVSGNKSSQQLSSSYIQSYQCSISCHHSSSPLQFLSNDSCSEKYFHMHVHF